MNPVSSNMFLMNMYLLIALLVLLAIAVPLLLLLISYIRIRLWQHGVKRAEREDYRLKHRPDGSEYPPFGPGLCDNCEQASDKVYFLVSGPRLCPHCYESMHKDSQPPTQATQHTTSNILKTP